MDATTLRQYLARLDAALPEPVRLCIYGSAAWMLLGEEGRFSLDMDVAGPYSMANERMLAETAQAIGWPVNPAAEFSEDHIEWVGPGRLCLASPRPEDSVVLWQGARLTIFTLPPADLAASRLIRYDPIDQADLQFLMTHTGVGLGDIARAVERLPSAFRDDVLVRENLQNLERDVQRWCR